MSENTKQVNQQTSKSKVSLVLLIIALVILAFVSGYIVYAGSLTKKAESLVVQNDKTNSITKDKTTDSNNDQSTTPSQTTRDPNRYYNDEGGYSFVVPEGWLVRNNKAYWEYFMNTASSNANRIAVVPEETIQQFENKNTDSGGEFFPNIIISVYKNETIFNNDFWTQTIEYISNFDVPKTLNDTINKLNSLKTDSANSDYRYDPFSGFVGTSERVINNNKYNIIEYQLISHPCLALTQSNSGKIFEIRIDYGSEGCVAFPIGEELILNSFQIN